MWWWIAGGVVVLVVFLIVYRIAAAPQLANDSLDRLCKKAQMQSWGSDISCSYSGYRHNDDALVSCQSTHSEILALLGKHASTVPRELLLSMAALPDGKAHVCDEEWGASDSPTRSTDVFAVSNSETVAVDFSDVRDLAQRELKRRGAA